jgi:hypothetical protein
MVPSIFANYFVASAGAGAALIGLLFVVISIQPELTLGGGAHPVRRGVASGAFTALTNAFFVSMAALIPLANVGVMAIVVSVVDIMITVALARGVLRRGPHPRGTPVAWASLTRMVATLGVSVALYGYEGVIGVAMLLHPHDTGFVFTLAELLLGVYAVGLVRAWELLGGPGGAIGRLLNPLQGLRDVSQTPDASSAETVRAVQVDARPPEA